MAPAGLVWAPQGVSSLSEGRDTAGKCSSCLFSEHLVLSGLAEVFFIKRPCDAQALIAKERGALEGQGRQCFLSLINSCRLDLENVVSLVLRRQVGSREPPWEGFFPLAVGEDTFFWLQPLV